MSTADVPNLTMWPRAATPPPPLPVETARKKVHAAIRHTWGPEALKGLQQSDCYHPAVTPGAQGPAPTKRTVVICSMTFDKGNIQYGVMYTVRRTAHGIVLRRGKIHRRHLR